MKNNYKLLFNNEDQYSTTEDLYPSIKNALVKIAIKEGYIHYEVYKKNISSDGGNCFGVLYEINIKGETANGNARETNIFVKQIIPNGDDLKLISVSEIYDKEVFIYTELANISNELQDKANIPMMKRLKFVKIHNESNSDGLLLENLTKQGFKTYGKLDIMGLRYAELCMEQLAGLHGLSFVTERRMPEYYTNKIKSIKQSLSINADYNVFANKVYKHATKKFSAELKIKTDNWWDTALENYLKYMQGEMTNVKCLCHGDFKSNNVMYRETEGTITEVIALDYQLAHFGSPVLDLIYFICMGTDKEFRRKHFTHLKDYYHVSLTKYLAYFDINVDDVYPKNEFEKDLNIFYNYALLSCILVMPFALNEEDGIPDLVDKDIIHIGLKFTDTYYDRLKGVFDDFFNP